MNEFGKESLSALLDGEVDDLELRRLLKDSETDPSLLEVWNRYHLVHGLLHGSAQPVKTDFALKVAASIGDELELPSTAAEEVSVSSSAGAAVASANWVNSLAKMAIAASVALVFIVSFQTVGDFDAATSLQVSDNGATATITDTPVVPAEVAFEVDPVAEQHLRDFIGTVGFDENEPVRIEHIQESPLYRLVNQIQDKP